MPFHLINRVYESITFSEASRKRIQFVHGDKDEILVHESDGCCDIGLSKRLYLALFKEGHDHFAEGYPSTNEKSESTDYDTVWSTYLASLALLTTTNEHMTVWRVHESTVWMLYSKYGLLFLNKEATYAMTLATSSFARINKSLMLWCWIRTLVIAGAFGGTEEWPLLMEQVLQSMEVHFGNYAAGFTAAWLVRVVGDADMKILELVKCRCKANVADVSLWTLIGTILLGEQNKWVYAEHERISSKIKKAGFTPVELKKVISPVKLEFERAELIRWLLAVEASYENPYKQLLRSGVDAETQALFGEKIRNTKNLLFKAALLSSLEIS